MHYLKYLIVFLLLTSILFSQNLTGVKICLDPGHGGYESDDRHMLETGFWESESNLTKGLFLKEVLESYGANVVITRTGNNGTTDDLSLSARVGVANSNSVDYFISIHSNGFDAARNYSMSIFNGKTGSPRIPDAKVMSEILCVEVMIADRTTDAVSVGDLTLNPTWTTGYGVLYPASMAANISEGSFHDYIPECWRLQSIDYRKQESWGIAQAILKFFEAGEIDQQMLSGIVRSIDETIDGYSIPGTDDKFKTLDNAEIKLISDTETLTYTTNDMNNGFFTFDSILPGDYTLIVSTENYYNDTVNVTIADKNFNFQDFFLISSIPPLVENIYPENGESSFQVDDIIEIEFSRTIDISDSKSKISFNPEIEFSMEWQKDNTVLKIYPDSIDYLTDYSLSISSTLSDQFGHNLDGNNDGIGGDDFVINFTTSDYDTEAPEVISTYPVNGSNEVETNLIINVTFNESLNTSSISDANIYLQNVSTNEKIETTTTSNNASDKTGITLIPTNELEFNTEYLVIIRSDVEDVSGNNISEEFTFSFHTGTTTKKYSSLDKFDTGVSKWWQPGQSGSTSGILPDKTGMEANSDTTNPITTSIKALEIFYSWDLTKSNWLLREYCPSGIKTFNKNRSMEAYIFGDGSMAKFRFCVDDNSGTEVSPWFDIDFVGWRLVSWDMSTNETGSWIGDGSLNGNLKVDSFQLTYNPTSPYSASAGKIIIDDYKLVTFESVAIVDEDLETPTKFALSQNYPNPFNPCTNISFQLPVSAKVELSIYDITGRMIETVVSKNFQAGKYTATWDATNYSSGVYIYSIRATNNGKLLYQSNEKSILMK